MRGFFFERLGKLCGAGRAALTATVLLTSGLFAIAHYQHQGLPGVEQAADVSLAACAFRALRAARVDPILAPRTE